MKTKVANSRLAVDERQALGAQARTRTDPAEHGGWQPAADRPDPVSLLESQNRSRDPDLVPVRHGRMTVSPFTFYRGTATVMAADLAGTPTAGLDVQLCGDAHLSNLGAYASPERQLVFDLNDFDETLPGPFEYDVKRLAASFTIAARNNRFKKSDGREATSTAARAYRTAMAEFAEAATMDLWYARISERDLKDGIEKIRRERQGATANGKTHVRSGDAKKMAKNVKGALSKAHSRTSLQAVSKLVEVVDGRQRIVSQPPVLIPLRELGTHYGLDADELEAVVVKQFDEYRATLSEIRRRLLDRFEIVDVARKVVGVGSVGTRAFIVLLQGRDEHDPLFLQVKEATASVLEAYLPASRYEQHGERVVHGQRKMQAASDIYLGWTRGLDVNRHFYWRQLRDMKGSVIVESMTPLGLMFYARTCGWTLARAHARSGDPIAVGAYLGDGDAFDRSITDFSARYADQNEQDFQAFVQAVRSGRLQAVEGV